MRAAPAPVRSVLMVCMGNICRSPTAEAVLRHKLTQAGLHGQVRVDSAGTHDYHIGQPPDRRAIAHAAQRGYDLSPLRARAVEAVDFREFDLILAMDWDNLERLRTRCPASLSQRLDRLMAFAPAHLGEEVPDPYYGDAAGFEQVLDLVESACDGLVARLGERSR